MNYTNQKQIRAAFWATFPNLSRKTIPDYVDELHRAGDISDALANRATL